MKTRHLLAIGMAALAAVAAHATSWRVNSSPYAGAEFATVAAAMNDIRVLPGDTLLLDAGSHGNISITRKNITVIGTGYFLDQNKQWAESQMTNVGTIDLSESCVVEGLYATTIRVAKGCKVRRSNAQAIASVTAYQSDVIIEQCFIRGGIANIGWNWIIRNNIITGLYGYPTYGNALLGETLNYGQGSIIENNTILFNDGGISGISTATFRNNIIINQKEGFDSDMIPYAAKVISFTDNNVIQNNVFSTPAAYANTDYPHNEYAGATIQSTFVNTGSDDAKYMLSPNSPAKGKATHGGDCGAFGGATPYVLSGLPAGMPHITEALVPAKPTAGKIVVKLKIETQND